MRRAANSISGASLAFLLNSFKMAPEIEFAAFSQDRQLRRLDLTGP